MEQSYSKQVKKPRLATIIAINFIRKQKELNLTLEQIKEKAFISTNTYRYIRKGKYNTTIATLQKIADKLGFDVLEFFKY